MNNLASLYYELGDPKHAIALRQRAIAVRSEGLGSDHPGVARLQINLAADFYAQGKYKRAEMICREFLPKLIENDPFRAAALHTIASVQLDQKLYERAIALANEAIAILDSNRSTQTLLLARCLRTKASALRAQSRYHEAESDLRQALGLLDQSATSDGHLTVLILRDYAALLHATSRTALAREIRKRASESEREWRRSRPRYSVSVEALLEKQ
jgi:tetratricopeptide (TPR) repeat protein